MRQILIQRVCDAQKSFTDAAFPSNAYQEKCCLDQWTWKFDHHTKITSQPLFLVVISRDDPESEFKFVVLC